MMRQECRTMWNNKWDDFMTQLREIHTRYDWSPQLLWEELIDDCWEDWEYWRSYCDQSCDGYSCRNRMMVWGESSFEKLNYTITGIHYD